MLAFLTPWAMAFAITWSSWSGSRAAECMHLTECDSHAPCALAVDAASRVQTVVVAADAVVASAFGALPRACWVTNYGDAYTLDPWVALIVLIAVGAAIYAFCVLWMMRKLGCGCTRRTPRWAAWACVSFFGLAAVTAGPAAISSAEKYRHQATCTGYEQPVLGTHVTESLRVIVQYDGLAHVQTLTGGALPSAFPVACYSDGVEATLWSPGGIAGVALGVVAFATLLASTLAAFEDVRLARLAHERLCDRVSPQTPPRFDAVRPCSTEEAAVSEMTLPQVQCSPLVVHASDPAAAPACMLSTAIEADLRHITVSH